MTKERLVLEISFAWWLAPALEVIRFFCETFRVEIDAGKIESVIKLGTRKRIVARKQSQDQKAA